MLIPKRTKYRKQHRPTRSGMSKGGTEIAFGDFGIQALAPAYITNRQIEAASTRLLREWVPVRVLQNSGLPTSTQDA